MSTIENTEDHLDADQLARVAALNHARAVLRGGGISAAPVEVTDLHSVAVFILDGGDPWQLDEVRESRPERPCACCADDDKPDFTEFVGRLDQLDAVVREFERAIAMQHAVDPVRVLRRIVADLRFEARS